VSPGAFSSYGSNWIRLVQGPRLEGGDQGVARRGGVRGLARRDLGADEEGGAASAGRGGDGGGGGGEVDVRGRGAATHVAVTQGHGRCGVRGVAPEL
jgi:hypothetical protein